MKLPWQKTENTKAAAGSTKIELPQSTAGTSEPVDAATTREEKKLPKGYTPPKGRPTPKRIEQEVKRGVVRDPNALTPAQQNQRNKELRKSMSKEEWKAYKKKQRDERRPSKRGVRVRNAEGRERGLSGRGPDELRRSGRD